MFDRTEWLSNIQIQGFFSRLCLKQRSKIQQELDDATDADDEDDHLIEASASDVDEECLREAVVLIGVVLKLCPTIFST